MIYKSKLKSSIVFTSHSPGQLGPSCHGGESQVRAAADMYSAASHQRSILWTCGIFPKAGKKKINSTQIISFIPQYTGRIVNGRFPATAATRLQ